MNPRYADQNKTITHQRVDECRLDFYDEDGKNMIVLVVLTGLFVVLYIVALIKRPGSRY